MQEIAVVIALLAALCYGGWRIYRVFRSVKAQKQAQKKKKADCWHKK